MRPLKCTGSNAVMHVSGRKGSRDGLRNTGSHAGNISKTSPVIRAGSVHKMGNSYFETREDFEKQVCDYLQIAPSKTVLIDSVLCFLMPHDETANYPQTYYREIDVHKLRVFSCALNADRKAEDRFLVNSIYAPTDYMELALKRLGWWD